MVSATDALAVSGSEYELPARRSFAQTLRHGLTRHIVGVIAAIVVVGLVLMAVFAPLIAPHSPTSHDAAPLLSPSWSHLAGTDNTGRDVFSRTVYGARVSLGVAFISVSIGTAIGVFGGLYSGFRRGSTDRLTQFTLDVGLSFPGILPLLVAVRRLRSVVLGADAGDRVHIDSGCDARGPRGSAEGNAVAYVEAARAHRRHRTAAWSSATAAERAPAIIVLASAAIPAAILAEAALSFLGLGIQPPTPSWGGDLSGEARRYFELQPWMALAPGHRPEPRRAGVQPAGRHAARRARPANAGRRREAGHQSGDMQSRTLTRRSAGAIVVKIHYADNDQANATRQRAPRLPAEERRKQILDAAVDVFARLGFGAAGTADIARGGRHRRANDLSLLLEQARPLRRRRSPIERRNPGELVGHRRRSRPTRLTALQRIGVWYYQRLQSRPELLLLRNRSISESQDESVANAVRDQYRAVVQFVETLFRRAHADGQLAAEADVTTMTWLFMAVGSLLEQSQILGLRRTHAGAGHSHRDDDPAADCNSIGSSARRSVESKGTVHGHRSRTEVDVNPYLAGNYAPIREETQAEDLQRHRRAAGGDGRHVRAHRPEPAVRPDRPVPLVRRRRHAPRRTREGRQGVVPQPLRRLQGLPRGEGRGEGRVLRPDGDGEELRARGAATRTRATPPSSGTTASC